MEVWKLCVKGIFLHQVENCFKKPRVFQLEVHLPDYFGADQKLKHVVKGTVQMPLQHWQAWGIDHLSGKAVPMSDNPIFSETALFTRLSIRLPKSVVRHYFRICDFISPWHISSTLQFTHYIYAINKWSTNKLIHTTCSNFNLEEKFKNATKLSVLIFDWILETSHVLQPPFSIHVRDGYLEGWQTLMDIGEYSDFLVWPG